MSNKPPIHDVIKNAKSAEYIELIDIPSVEVAGGKITLLRTKRMPEFAFVMWIEKDSPTYSKMVFNMKDGSHSKMYEVVCACCSYKQKLVYIKQALVNTCRDAGITTIFMRRAESIMWNFNDIPELRIVEAENHLDTLQENYDEKTVRDSLNFIDYEKSEMLEVA